jgi:hypothetical protein
MPVRWEKNLENSLSGDPFGQTVEFPKIFTQFDYP